MTEQSDLAIIVKDLFKTFHLPSEKHSGIKQVAINLFNSKQTYKTQQVLNDISFEIKKGEFFGIVGRNGSGKSTLLKLLAGIYVPDKGLVHINGSLTPFIELGVGFNPELTGRENIYMNGALLGLSTKEVNLIYDSVVSFAELERFMDQKLKNYSSGMQVRLAFSIAIQSKSDILLFDEVLAVGDASFQQKCYEVFDKLKANGKTIVLVTHDMSAVQRFCNKALLINKGKIELMGSPSEIADRYLEQNLNTPSDKAGKKNDDPEHQANFSIENATLQSNQGNPSLNLNERLIFDATVINVSGQDNLRFGIQVFSASGVYCYGTNTKVSKVPPFSGERTKVHVELDQLLLPGTYSITLAIMNEGATKVLHYAPRLKTFNVKQQTQVQGVTDMSAEWDIRSV